VHKVQYKQKRLNLVSRMEDIRHTKQIYRPIIRRSGQTSKKPLDG